MLDSRRVAPSPSPSRWFCSSLWVLMPPQPTMQVAMLDSRVASMLDQIKAEMEDSELSIGEAPWVGVVVQLRTWPLPLLAAAPTRGRAGPPSAHHMRLMCGALTIPTSQARPSTSWTSTATASSRTRS